MAFLNFLFKTNKFFGSTKEKNVKDESYNYFISQTKFIDYCNDVVLITISNYKIEEFNKINNMIIKQREEAEKGNINSIKYLDEININFNIYMLFYPKYEDEGVFELKEEISNQAKEIMELKNIIKTMQEQLGLVNNITVNSENNVNLKKLNENNYIEENKEKKNELK